MREVINWNENWSFWKGQEACPDAQVRAVTLPHTWNALDGQDGGNDYYQGEAWYRNSFEKQADWKQVFLRFFAVSKTAQVWCNGSFAGEHRGGFSAFTLDLTPYLLDGENEIRVKADNSSDLAVYPQQADFTFFGGIYREAELICFGSGAHFDVIRFGAEPLFVTPSAADGSVAVKTFATGGNRVVIEIFDASGRCVAKKEQDLAANRDPSAPVCVETVVNDVHLWDGLCDPYLYRIAASLYENGSSVDRIEDCFGFREFSVSAAEGFFLNGRSYPLHGVCRHQDRENMGWALTRREHLEDMALIREIGANTVRLAHYQQAPFFYDLCDRNGMVVWAEIPFITAYDAREEADENALQQMRELILQNYNHPSICFWGIANELGIGGESERMHETLRRLHGMAKELDPSRLTAIANVGLTPAKSELFRITDVASYNEYMGWYEGTADDHGAFCDERHGVIPEIPLAISEYGAESVLRWHSDEPKKKDYTEEYQALVHEKAYAAFEDRPYLWATWLWNMFDFAADARDEGGCRGRNNKGLVTFDRKIKKQAFYFYKACWSREPFVYLCGERFTKRAKDTIDVKAYSSQPRVDLWMDGRYIGYREGKRVFVFEGLPLGGGWHELAVRTPDGCADTLLVERVERTPEEYICREEKQVSPAVAQWFAGLVQADGKQEREIVIREGYLSVNDPMEEVYRYPEGKKAVQELIAEPLAEENPAMAKRLSTGGAMSFSSIWNHISKFLPDEAYYLLNERLNRIRK